ncbi:hypothetical protein RRF57_003507 [Xylaria bambusicola]|uniref:Uncharacterized protein n=1 Tax=Xylaria bambusicola TaxID=326684 RepID=A0AAN7UGL5_9PEZI
MRCRSEVVRKTELELRWIQEKLVSNRPAGEPRSISSPKATNLLGCGGRSDPHQRIHRSTGYSLSSAAWASQLRTAWRGPGDFASSQWDKLWDIEP